MKGELIKLLQGQTFDRDKLWHETKAMSDAYQFKLQQVEQMKKYNERIQNELAACRIENQQIRERYLQDELGQNRKEAERFRALLPDNDPWGLQEIIKNQADEIDRLRQRVEELEKALDTTMEEFVVVQRCCEERGERMTAMYSWLEWGGFEAIQDWNDVKDKWFDPETGEPL